MSSPPPTPLPSLSERLAPDRVLGDLMRDLGGALRADFAGVALRRRGDERYRVLGTIDRRREGRRKHNRLFPVEQTVASWVEQTAMPFVGDRLEDVQRFRQTATDMSSFGFASNAVVPLDVGSGGYAILYCLSGTTGAFTHDTLAVLARVRRILEPLTTAWLAALDLERGAEPTAVDDVASYEPDLTLAELERQHVAAVVERCNGIIEGPRGAAARLGLAPSTLRSRLRRLGLR